MILIRSLFKKKSNSQRIKMKRVLAALHYDFNHFSLPKFLKWLGDQHRTQLLPVPKKMPPKIFGAWIATERAHYFFYDRELIRLHQTHVILHEVCHWLCGHKTLIATPEQIQLLLQHDWLIPLGNSKRRSGLTNQQEQEAETLALLIQEEIARHKRVNGTKRDRSVQSFCHLLDLI